MAGLAIIFGFSAASAALLAQVLASLLLSVPLVSTPSLPLLIGAATIEEGSKLIFLIQFGRRSNKIISLLHALFFGIGFVTAEVTLLALSAQEIPDFSIAGPIVIIQVIGTLLVYGGLLLEENTSLGWLLGLLPAIVLHTLYNASL